MLKGFHDTDSCMIVKNKQTIARELEKPINTFIYLIKSDKFPSKTQAIFELLNDWTMGNIWDNLIIGFSHAEFTETKVEKRYKSMSRGPDLLFWKSKNEQLDFIKRTLMVKAYQKGWKRVVNIDGVTQSRLMKKEDFENIQLSALNFAQAEYCPFSDGKIDSKAENCWKLPKMKDDFDYYSETKDQTKPQYHSDQSVFENEIRKLYKTIVKNKKHPVTTQKEYFASQFTKDLEDYNKRHASMNKDVNDSMNNTGIDVSSCEKALQEVQNGLQKLNACPKWSDWAKWSDCAPCGHSKKTRKRNCTINNLVVKKERCQEELLEKETEDERICPFKSCDFTAWKDKTTCSTTCGPGFKQQIRECKGSPDDCSGDRTKTVSCEIDSCPYLTKWSDWSECSKTCGLSLKSRSRKCLKDGQRSDVSKCHQLWPDVKLNESENCQFKPCEFTQWIDKTSCSVSCGKGIKEQVRECKGDTGDCDGGLKQITTCQIKPCPIWTRWSGWSRCSKTCGNGSKSRTRSCARNTCSKTETDTEFCNMRGCKLISM